ncbi:hypothetical protein GCM10011514_52860 [Emticicia aquatilis]|uniref:HTH LytTR-type domain-containing protein n=1 Tax=Emticicia aquatilis TaxID=1537369 RepID=A0A916Z9A1_9BACT|nr:LytTR family DNA-binding domain-containing protein [Emticicia aquatilis]GGD82263.1 hypothetical protein GCM10011514_52860 [Emticicia aquatilis]
MMNTVKILHKKRVFADEIVMLKGNVNYTELHFKNGKKIILAKTLKILYSTFSEHGFFRINRSNAVNIRYLSKTLENYAVVKLVNNVELNVSRRRRKHLKEFIYETTNI